jgi:hypothetical protein
MPWMLAANRDPFRDKPESCPECAGKPAVTHGQCGTCGAMLVAEDPRPGESLKTTLMPADPITRRPVPSRQRRSIQIQDGWKRQADGGYAKVFRLVDRANNRYIERVQRNGATIRHVDEALTEHRGRGSAKRHTSSG